MLPAQAAHPCLRLEMLVLSAGCDAYPREAAWRERSSAAGRSPALTRGLQLGAMVIRRYVLVLDAHAGATCCQLRRRTDAHS